MARRAARSATASTAAVPVPDAATAADLGARLLAWYDRDRRDLPWRPKPGETPDPYAVWLSEIMLQQTTVAAVKPYYARFLERWPTVAALAAAEDDAVMTAWAGLGYYARARNLLKCARVVAGDLGGRFPSTEEGLRALPGVGAYTAAAIACICFGCRAVVVDGNVERVMARLFAVEAPLPGAKPILRTLADALTPTARCGDHAQAVMDLGATLCTPRSPACGLCPWMDACQGRRAGLAEHLPMKTPKAERPTRRAVMFWIQRKDGALLLRQRPASGLLGGMMELPSSPWEAVPMPDPAEAVTQDAPLPFQTWRPLPGLVTHTFSHFHLELTIVMARVGANPRARGVWVPLDRLEEHALPTVMRKAIHHALTKGF
ncbi:A/G-specific adenine glycosylase [Roseospira marina]|uniref:Adenine DNA glycosylase n=1 Tax=Roseospira marina TaxID=140057 RepID=A0A5M6ID16_9PROT|nr:A/G-specific adenine glycosylase [Roseospira marina]KAA5606171.1 A/G-specific adenine glycosylase [Roseospira marina]MBB4314312.1 A/G-specific adenine glycosylase [Roseospira marina]MBB5087472.1 A/G-specific adenine glycosylase [Roseospira marina]